MPVKTGFGYYPRCLPFGELLTPQSGFLQIPPHDGHPCLRLAVPATEPVVDFHHLVIAHAERTSNSHCDSNSQRAYSLLMRSKFFSFKVARLQGCKWVYGFAILL